MARTTTTTSKCIKTRAGIRNEFKNVTHTHAECTAHRLHTSWRSGIPLILPTLLQADRKTLATVGSIQDPSASVLLQPTGLGMHCLEAERALEVTVRRQTRNSFRRVVRQAYAKNEATTSLVMSIR